VQIEVPERLVSLRMRLEGRVKSLLTGERTLVATEQAFAMNELDRTEATADLFLSKVGGNYWCRSWGAPVNRGRTRHQPKILASRIWRSSGV